MAIAGIFASLGKFFTGSDTPFTNILILPPSEVVMLNVSLSKSTSGIDAIASAIVPASAERASVPYFLTLN